MDRKKIVKLLIVYLIISFSLRNSNQIYSQQLKVMTFNIYHGVNMKGDFDLDAIAQIINKEKPDFVALQEVDKNTGRTNHTDIPGILAEKTHMEAFFGKAMDFDGGEYGVAILSKHTVTEYRVMALPGKPNEEPRTSLSVRARLNNGIFINFISTHLDHKEKDHSRDKQVNKLINTYLKSDIPVILAGDFNDHPQSKPIRTLLEHCDAVFEKSGIQPTYPSDDPKRKIDYIFACPKGKWSVISSKVIPGMASDHRAFVAVIQLN
jgi:endonuclease/exonuclease/phosphatase family metal-dependent hydrolase